MPSVLEGVVILDLTQVLAGPFAVSLLGDFGAEIVQIEPPKGGFYQNRTQTGLSDIDNKRRSWNKRRHRKSLTLNLRKQEGKDIFLELVKKADVVVQNFSPGAMDRLGLGYEVLKKTNPGIIYCAISGFGQTGPYRERLAYDQIIQAASGIMSVTGFPDNPPVKVGINIADYTGAVYAIIGILLALYHKKNTGQGQMIDSSLFDALCHLTLNEIKTGQMMGMERFGNRYPAAILDVHQTKDGEYLLFTAQTDAQWESFLKLVGKEQIIAEKWDAHTRNIVRRDEVEHWASEWVKSKNLNEAIHELNDAALPSATIAKMSELEHDRQVINRNLLIEVEDNEFGILDGIRGIVPKLSLTPGSVGTIENVPELGQHTEEILKEVLGYSTERITALKETGVI
jgi:CoA:oxalate CoA-transferase